MAKNSRRSGGGGSGGIKGFLASVAVLTVVAAALMGVAKVNNINNIDDVFSYIDAKREAAYDCGIDKAEWNCKPGKPGTGNSGDNTGGGNSSEGSGTGVFNPSKPEVPQDVKDKAQSALDGIKVANPVKTDYSRGDWKHWTGSPCNSRIQTLQRDGENVVVEKCKVVSGNWADPYSDLTFTNSSDIDIDHIVPLAYANRHGGSSWDKAKKEAFANDPINLLASSAKENRKKSDDGPGDYMPPKKSFHCSYSNSWINITGKYGLTISAKDKKAIENGLNRC